MCGLEGQAMFECVKRNFSFNRCLRQGGVEAPRLSEKMATQFPANVEEFWTKKGMGILLGWAKAHQICSFMWADNLEQMLRDLKWDLAPKPVSRDGGGTYDPEEESDLSIDTKSGRHKIPL